ncbi:MAG: sensor histidine kinase [Vicinamibacterales bacterium]
MSQQTPPLARALSLAVHELRTPANVIAGYLRMLLKEQGGPLTETQQRMLGEAERACGRLTALVEEMSELGKLEGGLLDLRARPVNLSALVTEVAGQATEGADRGVTLEVRLPAAPVWVMAEHDRLAGAVRSLAHAALRERGLPGVVVAACTVTPPPAAWAVVTIGEEGLQPRLLARAVEAAPTLDEWQGGLGLSMPICRRLVGAFGGAVWWAGPERPRGAALRLPLGDLDMPRTADTTRTPDAHS